MLDQLTRRQGSRHTAKRRGRGIGSGKGRTCGRGQKGAGARSGHKKRPWSEGGQMPLARRLPKRGFHNLFRVQNQPLNVKQLADLPKGSEVTVASLHAAGLVPHADRPVKLLAEGELSVALTVRLDAVSAAARQKVEAAGGSVELVATQSARKGKEASKTS